jgi:pilus assembly protein CpaC
MFRLFRGGVRRAVFAPQGNPRRRNGLATALTLAIGVVAFGHQTLAPAQAQGRTQKAQKAQKNGAVVDGFNESSLVQLLVVVDKARTVGCDQEFSEVLVANPNIADVIPLSNNQVYVLGKKAGITSISLVGTNKKVIGLVNVEVAHDADGLTRRLRQFVPGSAIIATSVNGKVLLTGTVPDMPSLSRALAIAEQVAPGAVTNAMTVRGSQQVMLEVRFVEASRDSSRDLGVNWQVIGSRDAKGNVVNGVATGLGGLLSGNAPFGVAIARLLDNGTTADVLIQALEKRGVARRLAEPNLTTLSGDTASFLAGGEFPIAVQGSLGNVSVEFKKFGISLKFTPTVLGEGLINLKIEPEVSEIDPTVSISPSSTSSLSIPGLMVRRSQTTLELRDGQSFAMAGLLQTNHFKNQSELPWLGEVPVLGALFRSAAFQRKETDLVIIVTPRLVKPARPGQKLQTPLDNRIPSNDVEFFAGGVQEVNATRPEPNRGHILNGTTSQPGGGHILDIGQVAKR